MAEFANTFVQQVQAGQNAVFSETPVSPKGCVLHREGSGVFTLRGLTNQCRAMYRVQFSGNIAVPTGGTAGEITLALAVDGEALGSAAMASTPAAVEQFNNVSAFAVVCVPRGCCVTVSVRNTSTQTVELSNANISVERIS